jgi:hypothetical protein
MLGSGLLEDVSLPSPLHNGNLGFDWQNREGGFMARVVWWLIPLLLAAAPVKGLVRTTVPFDSDWRFLKADAPGAEQPEFADAAWRTLDVPHDWSIEGPFDQKNPAGGAGQVITGERTVLRVYGYRHVKPKTVKRDSEYLRNSIANHTHY